MLSWLRCLVYRQHRQLTKKCEWQNLGVARRHAQRTAVCTDWHGTTAVAVQLATCPCRQPAGGSDPAVSPADGGPGDPVAAALAHGAARHDPHPHLGRAARRGFGGAGPGLAVGSGA